MSRDNMPVATPLLEIKESPEGRDLLTNLCKQMNEKVFMLLCT